MGAAKGLDVDSLSARDSRWERRQRRTRELIPLCPNANSRCYWQTKPRWSWSASNHQILNVLHLFFALNHLLSPQSSVLTLLY